MALIDVNVVLANEENRIRAEQARVTAETARVATETARVQADRDRAALSLRVETEEQRRQEAEAARVKAEQGRTQAETARTRAEQDRTTAETSRTSAERDRTTAEQGRVTAETSRANAETARVGAERDRASAETTRQNADRDRGERETLRQNSEGRRQTMEDQRQAAEIQRQQAEQDRQTAEAARGRRMDDISARQETLDRGYSDMRDVTQAMGTALAAQSDRMEEDENRIGEIDDRLTAMEIERDAAEDAYARECEQPRARRRAALREMRTWIDRIYVHSAPTPEPIVPANKQYRDRELDRSFRGLMASCVFVRDIAASYDESTFTRLIGFSTVLEEMTTEARALRAYPLRMRAVADRMDMAWRQENVQ